MDKIFIFNNSYPNPVLDYLGAPFVHVRAKSYLDTFDVTVIKIADEENYEYEGVTVNCFKNPETAASFVNSKSPSAFLFHVIEPWHFQYLFESTSPKIIWVHGTEARSFLRIMFTLSKYNLKQFINYSIYNIRSLRNFRNSILDSNKGKKTHFVFVSNWMKKVTEVDTFTKVKNYSIIPNPIDSNIFQYEKKTEEKRKKILLLRSFNSKKYANDISVKAILKLSKEPFFKDLEFLICGRGKLFNELTDQLKGFSNIELKNKYFNQKEIAQIHKRFGVFLCPTRMDAQGVSMCEAMSSGLVPITSRNTAIPEFVSHHESGILTKSYKHVAESIEFLYRRPDKFLSYSENASKMIIEKSGIDNVKEKEINLIRKLINENL